jgi:hypothetical protein
MYVHALGALVCAAPARMFVSVHRLCVCTSTRALTNLMNKPAHGSVLCAYIDICVWQGSWVVHYTRVTCVYGRGAG